MPEARSSLQGVVLVPVLTTLLVVVVVLVVVYNYYHYFCTLFAPTLRSCKPNPMLLIIGVCDVAGLSLKCLAQMRMSKSTHRVSCNRLCLGT